METRPRKLPGMVGAAREKATNGKTYRHRRDYEDMNSTASIATRRLQRKHLDSRRPPGLQIQEEQKEHSNLQILYQCATSIVQ